MPLSLTTRRKQQTLSAKWSMQHHNTDVTAAASTNLFRHHQHHANYFHQPLRKQKSLTENGAHTGRACLTRGLSIGRSQEISRSSFAQKIPQKHSAIIAPNYNGKNKRESFKMSDLMERKPTKLSEQSDSGRGSGSGEFLRTSRRVQAWSSTSSILKTLDKELAHLNGVVGNCKDVKASKERTNTVVNVNVNKSNTDSPTTPTTNSSHSNRKQTKSEVNKVNLSIVLSHAQDSSKEEHDFVLTDREVDAEDSEDTSSNSGKVLSSFPKSTNCKKLENSSNCLKNISNTRPIITAQQRRALYRTSRFNTNLALSSNSNNTTTLNSGIQNSQNLNACPPSLNVQKRAPLVRAMSAPVRSFDEAAKDSTAFLSSKRKSRRRKLNTRTASCDKGSCNLLTAKDFNCDSKSTINRKVLTRSKSVAPDVVTLVSLISSEGSDSEKEENSLTPNNSHTVSPNRRASCLRKTGKSVSFQENYPPTYQFASKEYSHMLRRGSIAPLAQRLKSNRPPTAPPSSIYHTIQKTYNETPDTNTEAQEDKESDLEDANQTRSATMASDKTIEEEYEFPEYVRSLKERECWKLFIKMSTKGVNITYDTILRGMLTPTEFRQLQKQREIVEAKAIKAADNGSMEATAKRSPTAIERLKESLLKN